MDGSRTASNRSLQWGEQIVKPVFECKNDYDIMYLLATKLGFADRMFKNIKVDNGAVSAEDILREINRGGGLRRRWAHTAAPRQPSSCPQTPSAAVAPRGTAEETRR